MLYDHVIKQLVQFFLKSFSNLVDKTRLNLKNLIIT